jgi:hypothetical protein
VSVVLASFFSYSTRVSAAEVFPEGSTGHDVSFPQCSVALPRMPYAFGIVGVTGGKPFNHNPCLGSQYAWAAQSGRQPSLYMNLKSPVGTNAEEALTGPAGNCAPADQACLAHNFGYKAAQHAVTYARLQNAIAASWWLDIETMNTWSGDTAMNAIVIGSAIEFLKTQGVPVGIYSAPDQWRQIAGTYSPGLPVWIAMAPSASTAPTYCSRSFAGGEVQLVQYIVGGFDMNYVCRPADRLIGSTGPVGPAGSTAVVASDGDCLNVRTAPGLSAIVTTCLPNGAHVTLMQGTAQADGYRWQQISSGTVSGWVADRYLQAVALGPTTPPVAIPVVATPPPAPTQPERPFGAVLPPPGSFGLAVWSGLSGTTAEEAAAFLGATPGNAIYVADSTGEGFLAHVVGAPAVVNSPFTLATNQAVIVRMTG